MKERIIRFGLPALAVATSIGIGFAGVTSAQSTSAVPSAHMRPFGGERPALIGKITGISGTSITVSRLGFPGGVLGSASFTVDASGAKILKAMSGSVQTEAAISSLAIGDTVAIRGAVSGTTVAATEVIDGIGPRMGEGRVPGGGHSGAVGTVTAINGTTLTLTGRDGTTYTVDASSAHIGKMISIGIGDVAVGDTLGIRGAVSGTSITAQDILDGQPPSQH
jgi:hypothetical protein